ncbi:alpha/beta fold hydrolase, partial [Escherichia coli]|nr:alpha/beta fold hydrolase [Escherichia coli]
MAKLYWQTVGEGKQDLVLLHGWGLNAQVWQTIIPRIASHFRVHLVDLPGYGRSQG